MLICKPTFAITVTHAENYFSTTSNLSLPYVQKKNYSLGVWAVSRDGGITLLTLGFTVSP